MCLTLTPPSVWPCRAGGPRGEGLAQPVSGACQRQQPAAEASVWRECCGWGGHSGGAVESHQITRDVCVCECVCGGGGSGMLAVCGCRGEVGGGHVLWWAMQQKHHAVLALTTCPSASAPLLPQPGICSISIHTA